jgi:hypothetical protein
MKHQARQVKTITSPPRAIRQLSFRRSSLRRHKAPLEQTSPRERRRGTAWRPGRRAAFRAFPGWTLAWRPTAAGNVALIEHNSKRLARQAQTTRSINGVHRNQSQGTHTKNLASGEIWAYHSHWCNGASLRPWVSSHLSRRNRDSCRSGPVQPPGSGSGIPR